MKRALVLGLMIAACVAGILAIRGFMPFMPVFGTSMEPELQAGNLIMIEQVAPSDIKVGDIVVYNVPASIREYYQYPPVVAHRVVEVRENEFGFGFRTKGDNTGEDPFTVRAQDLRGTVSNQIPYLGFPLLFLQSQQGLIFVIIALCLFGLYLFADEFSRGKRKAHQGIFAPVIEESQRSSQVIIERMATTEKNMEATELALGKFASAMGEYAQHLQSHTSAIQGLAGASQELKKGAAEQNRVLAHLLEAIEQQRVVREETTSRIHYEALVQPPPVVPPMRPTVQQPAPGTRYGAHTQPPQAAPPVRPTVQQPAPGTRYGAHTQPPQAPQQVRPTVQQPAPGTRYGAHTQPPQAAPRVRPTVQQPAPGTRYGAHTQPPQAPQQVRPVRQHPQAPKAAFPPGCFRSHRQQAGEQRHVKENNILTPDQ